MLFCFYLDIRATDNQIHTRRQNLLSSNKKRQEIIYFIIIYALAGTVNLSLKCFLFLSFLCITIIYNSNTKNVQFHWHSRSPTFVFNICQMLQRNSNIIYNILTNIYSLDVFLLSSDVKKKEDEEEKEEEVIEGGFPTVAQTWQFLSYPTSFSPIQGLCAHGKAITDTHAHRLPHTASLIHTYGGHTCSHSSRK